MKQTELEGYIVRNGTGTLVFHTQKPDRDPDSLISDEDWKTEHSYVSSIDGKTYVKENHPARQWVSSGKEISFKKLPFDDEMFKDLKWEDEPVKVKLICQISEKKKLVILTGAGMSKESGIPTFRDAVDGLWENYDINDVCTADAMKRNPELIHTFYNELRNKYKDALPNDAHKLLAELEKDYDVYIITQNVDNLHEQAGSTNVLHLHGEIMKCRDVINPKYIFDIPQDENGNYNTYHGMEVNCHKVRPHIVFFGEDVPNLGKAKRIMQNADICVIIGTSFNVYPAASLIDEVPYGNPIYYIDPNPAINTNIYSDVKIIGKVATEGVNELIKLLQ